MHYFYFKALLGHRGFSLIGVFVGISIVATAGYFSFKSLDQSTKMANTYKYELVALGYASELAEFFRSLENGSNFRNYFNSTGLSEKLCVDQNRMTATGTISNPNPISVLPATPLDGTQTRRANRFFNVYVVDATTMVKQTGLCDHLATDLTGYDPNKHRYAATVSVEFLPVGDTQTKTLFLTVVLPNG